MFCIFKKFVNTQFRFYVSCEFCGTDFKDFAVWYAHFSLKLVRFSLQKHVHAYVFNQFCRHVRARTAIIHTFTRLKTSRLNLLCEFILQNKTSHVVVWWGHQFRTRVGLPHNQNTMSTSDMFIFICMWLTHGFNSANKTYNYNKKKKNLIIQYYL